MKNNGNRTFFQILYQYYPLIKELCLTGRLFHGRDELISFFSDFYNDQGLNIQATALFERMRDCGMIVKNHSMWGVPSYLVLFIRKREGRSKFTSQHFVKACLQDIKTHLFTLNSLLENKYNPFEEEILEVVFSIEDVYQQLADASQNNCHKISMEVSSFQLDSTVEISNSKIQRFHNLYDFYIMPMLAFVADPDNELDFLGLEINNVTNKILEIYTASPNLSYHVRALKKSVCLIQEVIASKILQAKNELDALFEVYREHRRIMDGINCFVEILNNKDSEPESMDNLLYKYCLTSSRIKVNNPSGRSFTSFLDKYLYFNLEKHKPPVIDSSCKTSDANDKVKGMIAFADIKNKLLLQNDVPCILSFLLELCQDESASFIIEKLFELENFFSDNIKITDEIKKFDITGIQLELPVRKWVNYD